MKLINLATMIAMAIALPNIAYSHGNNDRPERPAPTQSIVLDHQDIRSLNKDCELGLKDALRNKNIGRNAELVSVTVKGRASGSMTVVSLKVDGSIVDRDYLSSPTRRSHINHHEDDRRRRRPNLSSVVLTNSSRSSYGDWDLLIDPNVRVQSVIVTVKTNRNDNVGGGKGRLIKLGSFHVDKFVSESKTFRLSQKNIQSITLQSLKNSANVLDVLVTYRNGESERIYGLNGRIAKDTSETARLTHNRNRMIRSVTVQARSGSRGSRARLVVYAKVKNNYGHDHDHDDDYDRPLRRR